MRQPKLHDLMIDRKGTEEIRSQMSKAKKIKITINIDSDSLDIIRRISGSTGTPYQRLLNQFLKEGLKGSSKTESRIERLEKELAQVKRKLPA